jgi:hypothetical protein
MCKIEGCGAKPVARGLCPKHYMRKRRQGSPRKVGKPGRPRSPLLAFVLKYERLRLEDYGVEPSPRKLARWARQLRLHHAGLGDQDIVDRIEAIFSEPQPTRDWEERIVTALAQKHRGHQARPRRRTKER